MDKPVFNLDTPANKPLFELGAQAIGCEWTRRPVPKNRSIGEFL